jgi:membrane associated rhomboid family serine protease
MKPKLPRLPFVLLGLMTVFTFGGPVAFGYVLRGGASPNWPPDRPVEWATLLGISGVVVGLMTACLALGVINHKALVRASEAAKAARTGNEP